MVPERKKVKYWIQWSEERVKLLESSFFMSIGSLTMGNHHSLVKKMRILPLLGLISFDYSK